MPFWNCCWHSKTWNIKTGFIKHFWPYQATTKQGQKGVWTNDKSSGMAGTGTQYEI